MDPVQKLWMYQQWLGDQVDKVELAKNLAYLLASFDHPKEVKQMIGSGNVHQSTDEEFDETTRMVREMNLKALKAQKGKKRKRKFSLSQSEMR